MSLSVDYTAPRLVGTEGMDTKSSPYVITKIHFQESVPCPPSLLEAPDGAHQYAGQKQSLLVSRQARFSAPSAQTSGTQR